MTSNAADMPFGQTRGLLSAVMASCRDAIIAYSLDGQIEAWNRGAEEIYGFSQEEAIGSPAELTTPRDRVGENDRLREAAIQGRSIEHFDTLRTRKSGESFPAAICGFPIRNEREEVVGYATIERDISGRMQAADTLRIALTEAQEANAAKSRFLANASHELRTPMNAIVGMTALALEEDISHELRDYLETIRDSADSMLHLVNDVLDLAKFESDGFELEEVPFDPRELSESAIKVLGTAAHAKGLELVCHVAPDVPTAVIGDPMRLRQVLTNLLGNSIKFTAAGEVVVDVSPVSIEKKRCKLQFSVKDSGIGISDKDQERIFKPFTQVDGATTRRYSGTGLGLTITQHLIDCFGSQLELESQPGVGSRFTFCLTLPLASKPEDTVSRATEKLRGMTVLVVDDNQASRDTLTEQFAAWGMRPAIASSGREAMRLVEKSLDKNSPFDLAVVDALMPGLDGFTVASKIEGDERISTKPIIMASTTDRLEFSRRCAEAGAAAYIQKPISQSQLLSAVVQASGVASLDGPPRKALFDAPTCEKLRVLLVEDTPANRKVAQRVLSKRGHEIEVAVNGREALDLFRKEEFDVVLMDVQMPIMDGYQATEAIREIERSGGRVPTPIIAMTAHSMSGDREKCLRAGMDNYLSKPLDLPKLIRMVESVSENGIKNHAAKPQHVEASKAAAEPESPMAAPAADLDTALKRLRGDRGLLLDMMGFFEQDAPTLLAAVDKNLESGQLAEVERGAHSLKGLASTFDAVAAVSSARDVEQAAHDGRADALPPLVKSLHAEVANLLAFLRDYR
ncbi:Signal transduction histidine-protein kinase BarA [Posidoniimonas polymericola]|uniref:histidine kinase n=1 Tax=Posidoniimonas polymericola TaxID=2528002 RepID=A0A5C5YMG9_9BACT|nr:response regulator [Posidoniimonas polymericola]TWT76102.1 Signal transduction histidine-protein kinase BarA [Posidoniimonas polymericola]